MNDVDTIIEFLQHPDTEYDYYRYCRQGSLGFKLGDKYREFEIGGVKFDGNWLEAFRLRRVFKQGREAYRDDKFKHEFNKVMAGLRQRLERT